MIDWDALVVKPCVEVFGEKEPALFQAVSGASKPVSVIFDNAYKDLKMADDGEYHITIFPAAGASISDFPTYPVQGDNLTIQKTGQIYAIREVRDDSHGGVHLILNKGKGRP